MALNRWMVVLALSLALLGGCSHGAAKASPGGFAATVEYMRQGAGSSRLLLLGEAHGTRETPDLVAELVAAYSHDGPVLLGLEIARSEQAAISRFLDSDGSAAARSALRGGPFWRVSDAYNDGRRSHDMLDLIETVRGLRRDGRDVAILAYDVDPGSAAGTRERSMAERVRVAYGSLHSGGRLLVLGGNVHAMLRRPDDAPAQLPVPMGAYLTDLAPYSVRIDAATGQWWGCTLGASGERVCGPRAVAGAPSQGVPTGRHARSYHLQVVLPRFTLARFMGALSAP